ncbi:MAG: CRISPR-associated endonuclease Cas6 [candidate division Zixibacteria bacterium]|nr:CRISPR-associated endonuclease Cas6 [candidate division Zixibacteria bacterium]
MLLDYLLLTLKTDREVNLGASPLSLQIQTLMQKLFENPNYVPSGGKYPLIQYKVIRGAPLIVAVNEGCDVLWQVFDMLDEINEISPWKVTEKRVIEKQAELGPIEEKVRYRFLTPWLTLKEVEIGKDIKTDVELRNSALSTILESNFLAVARNFNVAVEDNIDISLNTKDEYIIQRDTDIAGFFGSFYINFQIPQFLGLGKSVTRGFGTVKQS